MQLPVLWNLYMTAMQRSLANTSEQLFWEYLLMNLLHLDVGVLRGIVPGNASLLPQIKQILGYDITPFLADLWYNDNPDSKNTGSIITARLIFALKKTIINGWENGAGNMGSL